MSDRYQYQRYRFSSPRGGGFGPPLTPMVQRLMIANGAVYLLQLVLAKRGINAEALFGVSVWGVFQKGLLYQPITYMWLHGSFLHVFFNMFALWMFGGTMEATWGSRRFLRFYLTCGVGAGVIILFWNWIVGMPYPTIGASGAIFGVLTGFSLTWPDRTIMLLFPPMPIKAIWFIPLLFVLTWAMGGGENISHIGHLGGVLVAGFLMRRQALPYLRSALGLRSLRYRWHRYRMRNRLRAVRRDEWERRRDDDRNPPTYH